MVLSQKHLSVKERYTAFDARILIAVWFIFVIFTVSVPKFAISTALAFAAFPLFVVMVCNLPARKILGRMLLFSPFILLIAAANPFIDTRTVCEISGFPVSAGLLSASVIIVKAMVSLAAVLTLVEIIPFNMICHSLSRIGMPEVFTTQLMLVYRYLFLLSEETEVLGKARELRSFNGRGRGMGTTSKMIGSLLIRSVSRSDRIYRAMLARGYNGTFPMSDEKNVGVADLVIAIFACASFLLVRILI